MRDAIRILCLLVLAALPASAEDLTVVSKITRDGGPPQTVTSYIASDRVRMRGADGNEVIAETASETFTMIDHKKKEYSVITKQEMQAAMAKTVSMVKEAQERLPAMREMMGSIATVDVQKVGGGRTVAGYHCEKWVVTIGSMSRSEQCLTDDLELPTHAGEVFRDFAGSESVKTFVEAMGQDLDAMKEKFKGMHGFPLANTTTTKVLGKTSTSTQEVTEIRKGPILASAWRIPADYKQVAPPMTKSFGEK